MTAPRRSVPKRNRPTRAPSASKGDASKPSKASSKPSKASSKPKPSDEKDRFWNLFSAEERQAMLMEGDLTNLVIDTYAALAKRLKAMGVEVTNPIIISGDGELFDPHTFNVEPPEGYDEDDEDIDEDAEDIDDDAEDEDDDDAEVEYDGPKVIKKLKKWIRASGWSQADVAAALDVSQGCISAWIDGRVDQPRDENCEGILELVELDPETDPDDID